MEEKKTLITYSGLKKMEEELQNLKINERSKIADKIKEARAQGDLSENAEYDAAKNEQGIIEARIAELESILKNVEVIDEDEADTDVVNVGCKVRLYDCEYEEEIEFSLVGSVEANSMNGFISNESPLGQALIGASIGETVDVTTPMGTVQYKILGIERNSNS